MTLVTRAGKGAPLSAIDHDGNLTHVLDRANQVGAQAISTVTSLQTALDGKAAVSHAHPTSEVTGLDAALAGKAATSHTHTASAVTDFSEVVDDRVAALLVAGANITLTYNDALNTHTIAAAGGGGVGVTTGTVPPATTPASVGLLYVDTVAHTFYVSVGTASPADWFAPVRDIGTALALQSLLTNADELLAFSDASGFEAVRVPASEARLATVAVALSDEATPLTIGVKREIRMPHGMTLTGMRASATTAPTGASLIVSVLQNGVSILSTNLSIDATEKTSTTAAVPVVISNTSLADDAEIAFDVVQVGSTVAGTGLKVTLIGFRA